MRVDAAKVFPDNTLSLPKLFIDIILVTVGVTVISCGHSSHSFKKRRYLVADMFTFMVANGVIMSGSTVKKGSSGVVEWVRSACRFASDRNDFRR
ncbi:hypothetical protein D4764_04G0006920 [Takifugu flavidus]|uniref:Uncharacterized protein n=1 Tax=Takifugu flavidus TaxID=433684 RepID=A0A5C6N4L5_9TELE|nr:hypothetical protein D4764_04G0006920 [Takifugu flavidus]